MRVSRRSPAPLAALLLAFCSAANAASSVPFDLAECLSTEAAGLASFADCGDSGSIEYCLANRLPKQSHLCTADVLAPCFVNAGCQSDEALIEAEWTIKRCEHGATGGNMEELRRRKDSTTATDDATTTEKTTTAKTTTAKTTSSTKTTSTTSTTSTATSASAASTASTATATSTDASTTAASSTTGTATSNTLVTKDVTDSTYSSTGTSLVCHTTTTVTTSMCPIQSTGTGAGKETLSCYSTVALYPTCAAGLMCYTDDLGDVTCMKKENAPGVSGIVIAIVFGTGVTIAIGTMCFFCCRERRQHNRMAKAAEAAAIARQAAIDNKRPSAAVRNVSSSRSLSADAQPLMPSPLAAHEPAPSLAPSSLYASETSGDIAGSNPFADHQQHQLR